MGLPLVALAVVLLVLAWGQSKSQDTEAATTQANMSFSLVQSGGPQVGAMTPAPLKTPAIKTLAEICGGPKCTVIAGTSFLLAVDVDSLPPGNTPKSYFGVQTDIQWSNQSPGGPNLTYKPTLNANGTDSPAATGNRSHEFVWCQSNVVGCGTISRATVGAPATEVLEGSFTSDSSTTVYVGRIQVIRLTCPKQVASSHTIHMVPFSATQQNSAGFAPDPANPTNVVAAKTSDLKINCQVATASPTATETATITNTPTRTNTPTATSTPAAPINLKLPKRANLFLTRQGTKLAPATCDASTDVATFTHELSNPTTNLDPKGSGNVQIIGGFEFEVRFNSKQICVDLLPGRVSKFMTCVIEDMNSPIPNNPLQNVARIGCVTLGKQIPVDGNWNFQVAGGVINCQNLPVNENPKNTVTVGPGQCTTPFGPTTVFFSGAFDNTTGQTNATIPQSPTCPSGGTVTGKFNKTGTSFSGVINLPCFGLVNAPVTGQKKSQPLDLATLKIRPQPELYSQIRAGQNNGVALKILNQGCKLTDQQGGAIPKIGCDDSDITIRFLEGDVEPNCRVDAADTQAIAFRWGSTKGKLIFNHRFDLMPAHPTGFQGDDRIDINDLQFVFGRFGSICTPQNRFGLNGPIWPPSQQTPVKPNA